MTDFEFIFALFGLLLGFSITEVLGGLARSLEQRLRLGKASRIGWLVPLLAAFVLLDLISFWRAAWTVRDLVSVSNNSLLGVTLFACSYYLAAHLVFPRDLSARPDLDEHFFRVRRLVIGIMLGLLCCQIGWYLSMPQVRAQISQPFPASMSILLAILMIGAILARSKAWATALMIALTARYLVLYLI